MKKRCLFFLCLVLPAISLGSKGTVISPEESSVPELVKKALPAVVRITAYDKRGEVHKTGTGFLIAPGKILTNAHVVKNVYSVDIKPCTAPSAHPSYRQPRLLKIDEQIDLALLEVAETGHPSLALETSQNVEIGQSVVAIGNPGYSDYMASTGIVSGLDDSEHRIISSAPVSPGCSGGPLLNLYGRVVGVNTSSAGGRAQLVNFAIETDIINKFLKSPDHPRPFPPAESRPKPPSFWIRILNLIVKIFWTVIKASVKFLWWVSRYFIRGVGFVVLLALSPVIAFVVAAILVKAARNLAPALIIFAALFVYVALLPFIPFLLSAVIAQHKTVLVLSFVAALLAGLGIYLGAKALMRSLREKRRMARRATAPNPVRRSAI